MKLKLLSFLFLTFYVLSFALAPAAHAQILEPGLTVTPSIEHLDLAVDPPEYELTYTNHTNSDITLNLSVQDFTELEEGYRIDFLQGQNAANYKYSLSSWVSFETRSLELSPGESKPVKIFIDATRITKGGHYASILAQIVQPKIQGQINVKAVLSSLLFVRSNTGQELEQGSITLFQPLQSNIEYPDTYALNFENNGNVQVIPYGLIQVYDPLGNLVAKGILDQNSSDTLPESIRQYITKVETFQKVLLPGFYTAKLSMHFGKTDKKLSTSTKFFSQGSFDFIKIGGFLILILIALIYLKRRKK